MPDITTSGPPEPFPVLGPDFRRAQTSLDLSALNDQCFLIKKKYSTVK